MLDKPPLEDARIAAGLREAYGLAVDAIEFLPRGYDSNAGVYRVRAGVETYFLKAKRNAVDELAVTLPRALQAHGLEEVVAPLPTVNGAPWGTVDGFTLLLYPFIEEQGAELTDAQWIAFGAFLKKLHTTHLPADLVRRLPRERFVPHPRLNVLYRDLQATVPHQDYAHPVQQQLAAFWRAREAELAAILDRAEQLGRMRQFMREQNHPTLDAESVARLFDVGLDRLHRTTNSPEDVFYTFREREMWATMRRVRGLPGPKKTAEEYVMISVLGRSED